MPLALPNLDDLTWRQLTEEGRSLIPAWAPEWTNHNPSDPGITIIELFAYLSEVLIYRLNRVGPANVLEFLRLMNGPDWTLADLNQLNQAKHDTIAGLHIPQRAVTAEDFENLTCAVNARLGSTAEETVARAKCIFRRNLEGAPPIAQTTEAPGHVSVLVVSKLNGRAAQASGEMLRRVRDALEPARMLTTRLHVVRPRYVTVSVRLTLVVQNNVTAERVRGEAIKKLKHFFDPLEGGPDGVGWPFGRNVYLSEIYQLLAKITGVDFVTGSLDHSTKEPLEELLVPSPEAGRRILNKQDKLEAIRIGQDELVCASVNEQDIAVMFQDGAGRTENIGLRKQSESAAAEGGAR